ncbi:MAG: 2,3-bisphosphoglycerate-independent phosphoglycerate mutase, partial [Candidatus Komeilibacteria bacterium CG_4_9_14_3_um_filter_37_5]
MFDSRPKPVVLIILDGWGVAAPSATNAITVAQTPNMDSYVAQYPVVNLAASGLAVGLPEGIIGSSEVGHLTMGSGQVLLQNLPLINQSIIDKSFFANEQLLAAVNWAKKNKSQLHLMGLISDAGVHSNLAHLFALLELAKQNNLTQVFIHAFLDGRDTPYNSGVEYVQQVQDKINQLGCGQIASICGRYYAMDRDNHWERTGQAYQALTRGQAKYFEHDPVVAVQNSYQRGVYDEECDPIVINRPDGQPVALVQEHDAIIFFNFRPDRGRQLTKAFTLPTFSELLERKYIPDLYFVTMTEYENDLPVEIAFSHHQEIVSLASLIAQAGWRQLHVAETEKYVHVTYFFNGRVEKEVVGEDRILISSPRVASYDMVPR